MIDQQIVYVTAIIIVGLGVTSIARGRFDPFSPIWLFLTGYLQLYVVQAISYREYAVGFRGIDLVTEGNLRALWALILFLVVYHCGLSKPIARRLPRPPTNWSPTVIMMIVPPMAAWGLFCSLRGAGGPDEVLSAEESVLRQFPIFMLLAGLLLIVTSRRGPTPSPLLLASGLAITFMYTVIWMFNGKRSHSLFGVLTAVCAYYASKGTRPSKLVLVVTAVSGALVVALAIGWRGNKEYSPNFAGFAQYVSEFDPSKVLESLNVKKQNEGEFQDARAASKETEEYCAYLLMLDTVPTKSEYDYGLCYLRLGTTFIPRFVWKTKPIYGREAWNKAWVAGSEFPREEDFTGPSIGLLGATQLNGGALATAIMMIVLALMLRTSYDFFREYESNTFVQFWWAATLYNAWLIVVNDNPFVWFYYIYGFTTMPPLIFLWVYFKFAAPPSRVPEVRRPVGNATFSFSHDV